MTSGRPYLFVQAAAAAILAAGVASLVGCAAAPADRPADAADSRTYAFWPQFPDEPRIQFVRAFGGSQDVAPTKSSSLERLVFGKETQNEALVNKPYGVAMHDGKIYVCDMRAGSLMVLDLKKKQTRLVGAGGINRLNHPVAVAVGDNGEIFVADNERGAVLVFDKQERYSRAIGFPKFTPVSIAVHGDRLYACDRTAQLVQVFEAGTGRHLGSIGTIGDEDGQFRVPLGVATDRQGYVYVVDMMRCRVQKFSPEGKFLAGVGTVGDYAGSFARPKHIAVDAEGVIYVVDAAFQNVQLFDDQFRLLMSFGAAGTFPGAMNLPVGICIAEDGTDLFAGEYHPGFEPRRLLVVTNQFGPAKVNVYALGQKREGYTAADLAKAAAVVSAGVGTNPERLKLQEQGTFDEPPPGGSELSPESPATDQPAPPPAPPPTPSPTPQPPPTQEPKPEHR